MQVMIKNEKLKHKCKCKWYYVSNLQVFYILYSMWIRMWMWMSEQEGIWIQESRIKNQESRMNNKK